MLDWLDISGRLGLPPEGAAHAHELDYMLGLVHWLMLLLFVIWAPYFIYVLFRFRKSKHPAANYHGTKSRLSTYLEGGVVVAEVVLLFGFALPVWGELRDNLPAETEAVVVHVVAEQFAWNIHYPGPDGVFGRRDAGLVDTAVNPLGLDREDTYAKDDITTVNELHLPAGRPVLVQLSSKDVIHSFALPVMRVKQDAIPGLTIPVWFQPTRAGEFEIACAQLCGIGHYRMRGYLTIHPPEAFEAWLQEAAAQQAL
jgi:cytochrome c oxidase subunit 2